MLIKWLKEFSLRVWARIRDLFGRNEMQIETILNNWFEETRSLIRDKIVDFNSIDGLCESCLLSAREYCCAVLHLLRDEYEMPAKALLRCLCELSMKLFWCLRVPDGTDDKGADAIVKRRIRCWEKDTLCGNVEILEAFRDAANGAVRAEIEKALKNLRGEPLFSDMSVKQLPPFKNLVAQLPDICKDEVYPLLYLQFNNAVHLDVTSLVENYMPKVAGQSGHDSSKNLEHYCVINAFHINGVIRRNYGIDIGDIKQEFYSIRDSYLG